MLSHHSRSVALATRSNQKFAISMWKKRRLWKRFSHNSCQFKVNPHKVPTTTDRKDFALLKTTNIASRELPHYSKINRETKKTVTEFLNKQQQNTCKPWQHWDYFCYLWWVSVFGHLIALPLNCSRTRTHTYKHLLVFGECLLSPNSVRLSPCTAVAPPALSHTSISRRVTVSPTRPEISGDW